MRGTDRATLGAFYVYQASVNSLFFQPVFFAYYGGVIGLAVPVILVLQSYNLGVRSLLELPLGALADHWSRRGCLVASALAGGAGAAALLLVPSVVTAVLAETAFATANALRSGADSALLYDALAERDALAHYPQAESHARALAALGAGLTAVAGGYLASVDLRLPYAAACVAAMVGAVVAARLPERRRAPVEAARGRRMREAAAVVRGDALVRWTITLAALTVVSSHVYYFMQQPYMEAVGVPIALFGVVFAATKLVTAITAASAHRLDLALGPRPTAAVMTAVPALGLGAMALVASPIGTIFVLSRGLLDGLWEPLLNVYMNRLAPGPLRATLLSLQNLFARLALAIVLSGLAVATRTLGIASTLAVAAAATATLGTLLVLRARPGDSACRPEAV